MSKLYRSLLWSGLLVAGVTACGDDVTVAPPPGGGVNSVTVGPTGITIAVGQTLQMAAAVNANTGIATTVSWATSNSAIASVSATGLVTGVASGSVAITACSTVNTSVCGQATVTVASSAPATISIHSITAGGTQFPVQINNVFGQIDVTLNLDAGTQQVSNVQVLIDGAVACQQGFSAIQLATAQAQAALLAGDDATAALVIQVVCSVNTADFDATTGVPKYFNGARLVTARVNLVGSAPVATPSTTLVFNNSNTFAGTMTVTTPNTSATNTTSGLLYRRGGLSFTVLPVIFTSGTTFASGSVTFGGCSTGGARNVALTAPATGSFAWTASLSNTATSGTTVTTYEFNSGICAASITAVGEGFTVSGVDALGNTALAVASPALAIPGIRLDNFGPGAPQFAANPNGRQNGWINDAVSLTGSNTGSAATANNWLINGTLDIGVGGTVRMLRIGTSAAAALAATASAAPVLPVPAASNVSYCAVASTTDLLGNESALPSAATTCAVLPPVAPFAGVGNGTPSLQFGVDTDEPTIVYNAGSLADVARINGGTIGGEFMVDVADVGAVGVSGMLAGSPVKATVIRRTAAGTTFLAVPNAASDCVVGTPASSNTLCNLGILNNLGLAGLTVVLPTISTIVTGQATPGYYTYNSSAFDAAGNFTPVAATRTVVSDNVAPALTTALFNTPLSGSTATFTANSSDNLDLWKVDYTMTYGATLAGPIAYPSTIINTFNAAVLLNSNVAAGITINGFMRQVQNATNVAPATPLTVGGADKPSLLNGTLFDQAGNTAGPIGTVIPPASVTNGVSYVKPVLDPQEFGNWAVSGPAAATNVSTGGGPAAAVNPLSVTLQADAFGRTATFAQPFTRVDFYVLSGGNLVQIGTGTLAPIFDDGSAFGRRFRWTFSWAPGTAFGTAVQSIFAIGVNANGDALITPVNTQITTTNP